MQHKWPARLFLEVSCDDVADFWGLGRVREGKQASPEISQGPAAGKQDGQEPKSGRMQPTGLDTL